MSQPTCIICFRHAFLNLPSFFFKPVWFEKNLLLLHTIGTPFGSKLTDVENKFISFFIFGYEK